MYQILVVDDEQLTLDYLRITIPKQDPLWEVAHTCLDGISALAWLETHSVDLVITDIKMPEMSGLQLCQEIKKCRPRQKIVILSGYDDFKFAQEAIRYDVRDYLLKPISLECLHTTLTQIREALDAEHQESLLTQKLLELSNTGRRQLACHFILSLIENNNTQIQSLYPVLYQMKISLLEGTGLLMVLRINEDSLLTQGIPLRDFSLFHYILYQLSMEYLSEKYPSSWVTTDQDENTLILLSADTDKDALQTAATIWQTLSAMMAGHTQVTISAGVSNSFYDIFDLPGAYQQAVAALQSRLFCPPAHLRQYSALSKELLQKEQLLDQSLLALITAISENDSLKQQLILQSLLDMLPSVTTAPLLLLAFYWIRRVASQLSCNREALLQELPDLSVLCQSPEKALTVFSKTAAVLSPKKTEKDAPVSDKNDIVTDAEQFIHTHYAEPISLALLADELHISPNYLSALFHRELGESYNKYVTRVRMEHATRLMKAQPELKMYEIAEAVGYISAKHFTCVFKQYYGITPGEYVLHHNSLS